ncbi:MAG: PadR family transcriptional regulator [Bacteroidota bacterium]
MISRELSAASSKPIVLGVLSKGENYGYAIIQEVKRLSDDKIEWREGALYPVLHRLEKQGFITSNWHKSAQGRKRKYYQITQKGLRELAAEKEQWHVANAVLGQLWGPKLCLD